MSSINSNGIIPNNTRIQNSNTCPALMYGGQYTDYRINKDINDFRKYTNIRDSNDWRLFLQHNGEKMIKENQRAFAMKNACCPCEKQPNGIVEFNNKTCKR